MKKPILYLSVLTLTISCGVKNKLTPQDLSGIWTEHWVPDIIDPDKSVNYVDTLKLYTKNNQLNITCINYDMYVYSDIQLKGNQLTFTKENLVDPNERFFVYYTLTVNKKRNECSGGIINSVNEENKVSLKKMQ
ncbi:hypothetical protein H1R17_01225 [Flavobacterium sp. xlx-214]|uniref:hypothetical protein n=1 Tax=unclassified Flavobacterium TaxID=196869 RepID=UPI0013D6D65F|nr:MULTISPECIES: hypothetical protein [unclassified Flavobacterium]MBA5792641.1 hypothetical protein [Flavobacterium sp. xlx-221]QMI83790.1 hypothetical protein H1R17_01225 [Flavobacterium sp. xlx-214]